jgi:hypothetical protein
MEQCSYMSTKNLRCAMLDGRSWHHAYIHGAHRWLPQRRPVQLCGTLLCHPSTGRPLYYGLWTHQCIRTSDSRRATKQQQASAHYKCHRRDGGSAQVLLAPQTQTSAAVRGRNVTTSSLAETGPPRLHQFTLNGSSSAASGQLPSGADTTKALWGRGRCVLPRHLVRPRERAMLSVPGRARTRAAWASCCDRKACASWPRRSTWAQIDLQVGMNRNDTWTLWRSHISPIIQEPWGLPLYDYWGGTFGEILSLLGACPQQMHNSYLYIYRTIFGGVHISFRAMPTCKNHRVLTAGPQER